MANPKRAGLVLAVLGLAAVLAACGGGGDPSTPIPIPPPGGGGPGSVEGTWRYEFPVATTSGMNYGGATMPPVRGAIVQLVQHATNAVIAASALDAAGFYHFDYGGTEDVRIRVLSETQNPPIRVEDNTSGNATWAVSSTPFAIGGMALTNDYQVPMGWTGSAYSAPTRLSGPFAILDAAYEAAHAFLAERTVNFPLCILNWSPNNRPQSGDPATGAITTSHFDGSELYILGQADVDTDEYDDHVVVHEWGHYYEGMVARSDSIGGSHGSGDLLDPRVAFGEGWGNALSAMILYPNSVYADTYGAQQANGFGRDMESNTNVNPGWFSEGSVQSILYDIFDPDVDGPDTVNLGLGPIHDAFVMGQVNTPTLTTIFSFCAFLKGANGGAAAGIDALCTAQSISAIADAFGSTETHDAGWSANLPVYRNVGIGNMVSISFDGSASFNQLEANRYVDFIGNGGQVTVRATTSGSASNDVRLLVYATGQLLGASDSFFTGTESVSIGTMAGQTYLGVVQDLGNGAIYSCTVQVTSP